MDAYCESKIAHSVNMLVPWYLIASYAYYVLDSPVLSDDMYDRICFLLAEEIDCVNISHRHLSYCDTGALNAGTAYHITEYPSIVASVAERFVVGGEVPDAF